MVCAALTDTLDITSFESYCKIIAGVTIIATALLIIGIIGEYSVIGMPPAAFYTCEILGAIPLALACAVTGIRCWL